MTDVWKAAVAAERPDLVLPSDPWERATDTTTVAGILADAGIPEALTSVMPAFDRWPLRTPRDWWSIVMGTGLRWTVDQLTEEQATRVRQATPRARASAARRLDHLQRAVRPGHQAAGLSDRVRPRPARGR